MAGRKIMSTTICGCARSMLKNMGSYGKETDMAVAWHDRIKEWEALGDKACQQQGRILLVNNQMTGERIISDEQTGDFVKDMKLLLKALDIDSFSPKVDDMMYPMNCLYNTPHHALWDAKKVEHVRLCVDHARKDGWLW